MAWLCSRLYYQGEIMAVPNTFTNGTVADADDVNENFVYVDDAAILLNSKAVKRVTTEMGFTNTGTGQFSTILTTNAPAQAYDLDIATYYDVYSSSVTTAASTITSKIDFGRLYYNTSLSYSITIGGGNNMLNTTYSIDYSLNGTDWTNLASGNNGAGAATYTKMSNLFSVRYFRVYGTCANSNCTYNIKFNEIMLTGL